MLEEHPEIEIDLRSTYTLVDIAEEGVDLALRTGASDEGAFSIFKRGMKGVYQHCAKKHLHRYVAEFEFRYTHRVATGFDDRARADRALCGIVGKRITYRRPDAQA